MTMPPVSAFATAFSGAVPQKRVHATSQNNASVTLRTPLSQDAVSFGSLKKLQEFRDKEIEAIAEILQKPIIRDVRGTITVHDILQAFADDEKGLGLEKFINEDVAPFDRQDIMETVELLINQVGLLEVAQRNSSGEITVAKISQRGKKVLDFVNAQRSNQAGSTQENMGQYL